MVGKRIRMERIMDRVSGKTVIVPMDHGVTLGPMRGLTDMRQTINAVAAGGANAIVIHKGLVGGWAPQERQRCGSDRPPFGEHLHGAGPQLQSPGVLRGGGHQARSGCRFHPREHRGGR